MSGSLVRSFPNGHASRVSLPSEPFMRIPLYQGTGLEAEDFEG